MTWYIYMTITWNKSTDDLCLYLTMTQNQRSWIQNLIKSHRCKNLISEDLKLVSLEFYCESAISSPTKYKIARLKGKKYALLVFLLVWSYGSILRWKIKIEQRFKIFKTINFFFSFLSFLVLNLLYSVSTFFFNFFS